VASHQAECPDLPDPPDGCQDGDYLYATGDDGGATYVRDDGEWRPTGARSPTRVPVEDEDLAEHRGCSLRTGKGAVYLVDARAAWIGDAFATRLDRGSIRELSRVEGERSKAESAGRKLFNEVVDEVAGSSVSSATIPTALEGGATVRGPLVLFDRPPVFERRPRASFRSLAHIDGDHLIDQIAAGASKPTIRSCRQRTGATTHQETIAVIAERVRGNKAFTRRVLTELSDLASEELVEYGQFRVPGLGTLRRSKRGEIRFEPYEALKESRRSRPKE
jgi:hypothetical protein